MLLNNKYSEPQLIFLKFCFKMNDKIANIDFANKAGLKLSFICGTSEFCDTIKIKRWKLITVSKRNKLNPPRFQSLSYLWRTLSHCSISWILMRLFNSKNNFFLNFIASIAFTVHLLFKKCIFHAILVSMNIIFQSS